MIEISGWVSIGITANGEDNSNDLNKVVDEINQRIESIDSFNQFFKLINLNGSYTLFIGLNHNHDNGYSDLILELLNQICVIAHSSYGLIYVRCPEHETDYNQFKVWKIVRGKISQEEDCYLSPCNPVIED